ncbi:MarR family winged helix-turn-helix transcriptional regulator [Dokdonella sp.]|uniref:MarR family winged helix-turn-helix transcriptional regulator n=1 Tax=Dokdonella sp. TaxID=2291710 RepID=UPI003784AD15
MIQTTDNTFAYRLHDVTRLMRKHFDRRATRLQLTRAQWRALKVIRRHEGLSQAELADNLDMQPIPVGRVIDRLEKTGFVERRADPTDRRRWRLHLAAKAHAIVDEMEVIGAGLREEALRGVKPADFEALLRVLAQIKDNLVALDGAPTEERGKS